MALFDLDDIQKKVSSYVDQSTTTPSQGGDEYTLRTEYVNMSIMEWAEHTDWEALRKVTFPDITGVSQASISLPADFRKTANYPRYYSSGVTDGEEWAQIPPNEYGLYDTSDKYFYVLGDRFNGFTMVWNPGTIASGASLRLDYFSYPTSLVSPADLSPVPDPMYLVHRTVAYILESRYDARFQQAEAKARETLINMKANQDDAGWAQKMESKTNEELYHGFRLGRD